MRALRELAIVQCADEEMLRRVLAFDNGFLPRIAALSDDVVIERFHRCPDAFWCIVDGGQGEGVLHGYFLVLPLSDRRAAAVMDGRIKASRDFALEDLATSGSCAPAVYVSVVCAAGARAQAAAVHGVAAAVGHAFHHRQARLMFVRAASEAGTRIVQRLTGTAFTADGVLHSIDLKRYDFITRNRHPSGVK